MLLFLTFKIIGQVPTFWINGYIIVDTRHKMGSNIKILNSYYKWKFYHYIIMMLAMYNNPIAYMILFKYFPAMYIM